MLSDLGAKVNKSCGLHVHLDCRKYTEPEVIEQAKKFGYTLDVLERLVPKSRRDNNYCKLEVGTPSGDRYKAINLASYRERQTIEVRLHSGTTDFNKIINWARLMHGILNSNLNEDVSTLAGLAARLNLDGELFNYFKEREKLFNKDMEVKVEDVQREAMDLDNTEEEVD